MAAADDYPFADFLRDVDALEANGTISPDSLTFLRTMESVAAHFCATYPDTDGWVERVNHFMRAMSLLASDLEAFDLANLAVIGSRDSGSLVSEGLLHAVHEAAGEASYWTVRATPESIIERTRSYPPSAGAPARALHIGPATLRLDFEEILREDDRRRTAENWRKKDQSDDPAI